MSFQNLKSTADDILWMKKALRLASLAKKNDEVPVGALIVRGDQLISMGLNQKEGKTSPLAHAEIQAIDRASRKLKNWRLIGCTLYVTLEPCAMCAGALLQSRIKRVVFALPDPKFGALQSLYQLGADSRMNHQFDVQGDVLREESLLLLQEFFAEKRKKV